MRGKRILLVLPTAMMVIIGAAPTSAAPTDAQVVAGPTAKYYGYATPVVVVGHFPESSGGCRVSADCARELVVDYLGWAAGI